MKKQSLFFTLFLAMLLFAACGGGSKNKPTTANGDIETPADNDAKVANFKKNGLKGDVKSVRQRVYWALEKFGRMEKGKLQNLSAQDYLKVYNEYGLLVEETHYDINENVVSRRTNTYNGSNLVKEEFFDAKKCIAINEYSYEGKHLKQKDVEDGTGKLKERYMYSYYEGTDLVQDEDKYNTAGKLTQKIVHVYENDKISEKQYYTGGGYPFKKDYFSHDDDGNLTVASHYKYQNKEEVYDGKTEYGEYSSAGDCGIKTVYDKTDQATEITKTLYDEQGNLIEYTISRPKKIDASTTIAQADTAGVKQEDSYFGDEEVDPEWTAGTGAAYEYSYDDLFNWIKKITYKTDENGKKNRQYYYERVIEYR